MRRARDDRRTFVSTAPTRGILDVLAAFTVEATVPAAARARAVNAFLEAATDERSDRAARISALHPGIATANLHTALVLGDVDGQDGEGVLYQVNTLHDAQAPVVKWKLYGVSSPYQVVALSLAHIIGASTGHTASGPNGPGANWLRT